jgi:hypothetical protein
MLCSFWVPLMAKKPPQFKIPQRLDDLDDQLAYCIGTLVAAWANCESLFFGIFASIVGKEDSDSASIIWLNTKSTKARIDTTLQLLHATAVSSDLKSAIEKLASQFDGVTRTRNFYCHSYYKVDPQSFELREIESYTYNREVKSYSPQTKLLTKATVNEIADTIRRTNDLNARIWPAFLSLRGELAAQHVSLPEPFPEFLHPE